MIKYNYKKIPNATTATIRIVVNAGSDLETIPGTAHFLEHMIFKGTLDNSYEEINKKISRLGSTNAYTSSDKTVFHIVTTVEGIKEATETLLEMVTRPAIDVEEIEKEKGVILEEYRSSKDDSFGFLYDSACFALTNGETHSILGDENSIKSMSDLVIREFYRKYYTQNNICINLVGNLSGFTEAAFKKIIQKYESNLQTGEFIDELQKGAADPEVSNPTMHHQITELLLEYSSAAKKILSRKQVKFRMFPGGIAYENAFLRKAVDPIAKIFAAQPELLVEAGILLGGRKLELGQASVEISAFNLVPITYILWVDEELPPTANVLYDESANNYLNAEGLANLAELATWRLILAQKLLKNP